MHVHVMASSLPSSCHHSHPPPRSSSLYNICHPSSPSPTPLSFRVHGAKQDGAWLVVVVAVSAPHQQSTHTTTSPHASASLPCLTTLPLPCPSLVVCLIDCGLTTPPTSLSLSLPILLAPPPTTLSLSGGGAGPPRSSFSKLLWQLAQRPSLLLLPPAPWLLPPPCRCLEPAAAAVEQQEELGLLALGLSHTGRGRKEEDAWVRS